MGAERITCAALRRVLEPLPVGARIERSEDFRKFLGTLEHFLSAVLEATYPKDWRYESLDGLLVAHAFKTEALAAELTGMCYLITDQTLTPFHVRLRIAEATDEIEWGHCELGEQTEDGLRRFPSRFLRERMRALRALDVSAIAWAYEVELHGWCSGP
jgi:hypothetical protein